MSHVCEPLENRIRRFPRELQRRLRKLVKGSKQLKDLVYSFPAAIFVLSAGNRSPDLRARGLALVKEGKPLAEVAAALELPLWTRQVPPEALGAFGALPDNADFNRRVVNLIPRAEDAASGWLASVSFAAEACNDRMALWLAGQRLRGVDPACGASLLPMAAFIWFSQHRDEAAHQLIGKPWQKTMSFRKVAEETRVWIERIILDYCFEDDGAGGGWFKVRKSCGFRIVPLRTAAELREEGERMANCVGSYAKRVADGRCLIYAIQHGSKSVATLEVVADLAHPGKARLAELAGPANTAAPEPVVHAARSWMAKQGRFPLMGKVAMAQIPVQQSRWSRIWRSYFEAKPQFAPMLEATPEALRRLCNDLDRLDRCQ